jgi:hypothetical protein
MEAVFPPVTKQHYRDYLGWSRWFYAGDWQNFIAPTGSALSSARQAIRRTVL